MFQFPRLLSLELCIHSRIFRCYSKCVPTFGYPRIVAYLQLPEAFRRSSRPSSASIAKASSMRPYLFNHQFLSFFDEFEILIIDNLTSYLFTLFLFTLSSFQRTIFLRETISQNQVINSFSNLFLGTFRFRSISQVPLRFFFLFSP